MELMPLQLLVLTRQETIAPGSKGAIANLKSSPAGCKREESRHGPSGAVKVGQGSSQQQHAAAFGVDRQPP